ncbi:MAG TPA: GNAT family N-acetyltransferase [Steroidobacteraceae bacterium]
MNHPSPPQPADLPPGYPAGLERAWQAADGTTIRLRALRPDDLDREMAFIAGLSEETLYQRLQYSSREVNRQDAARLLVLDYRDRMAIGALVGAGDDEAIIGVSRYARIDDTDQAECAIVVTDAWHGRGIGTELMRSLAQAARANGIRGLVGSSLAENQRIHAWARRFGFDVRTEPNSGGAVRITVDLGTLPS